MVSVRKRLTRRPKKSKVSSGTEDSEKENFLNELPIAPLNDNSFALPSTSAVENNDGTRPSPVQVLGEKCFSPRRAIGLPPVSLGSPNPLHGFPDCIISSSTGILKSRNDISLNGDTFEEGALFNSTPTKNYSGGPLDDDGSALSFSSDAFEEQRLQSPTPVTSQTENNGNSQLSVDDHSSSKKLFTVSSMCLVDASSSGIYPCPPKLEVSNAGNSSSKQNHPSQTVQDLLISQLPPAWELAAGPSSRTSFMLGMNASEDLWCSKQRSVLIGKDGTVQIAVHGHFMSLDHPIWQELPCRVGLTDMESVDEFVNYILGVVKVIRSFVICIGLPESHFAIRAAKHPGLVFDPNPFRESRYTVTYRSVSCEMLLSTKIRTRKYCSFCYKIRHALFRRSLAKDTAHSPHAKVANKWLDSTQKKQKLGKLSRSVKNSHKREDYHRAKAAALLERHGVDVDVNTSSFFKAGLDKHFEELDKEEHTFQRIFIEQQLKASKVKGPTGMRWHPLMIRLALRIHMASPAALDAIAGSGIIHLPSSRTLFDYSHFAGKVKQGINFAAMKVVVDKANEHGPDHHKRYFILLMDEMSISQNLVYSRATGEMVGFAHLDKVDREVAALEREMETCDSSPAGSTTGHASQLLQWQRLQEENEYGDVIPDVSQKVLCYMAVGVTNGLKQVVASYGVTNITAYGLSRYTWDIVQCMEGNDAHVLGLVCDGHPVNRKFITLHTPFTRGVSNIVFDTGNRYRPGTPFYFFSDVPHLLKTIRNCFHNSEAGSKSRLLKKDGECITWRTIIDLYEQEKDNEVRMAHKLNAQVVYLNSYSRMKVSYAARVFSRTVANAIKEKFPERKVTIDFITRVNDFFDCLNGAALLHGSHKRNKLLEPYRSENDERFRMLKAFNHYLKSWRKECQFEPHKCISDETLLGVEMTVHSFDGAVKFMLRKGAKFVLARVFCQDPLEQHFSKQRGACGGNRNPNLATCLQNENKLLNLKNLGFRRQRGNTTQVVRDADYADRICAPLLKRRRSLEREKRVNMIRKALSSSSGFEG